MKYFSCILLFLLMAGCGNEPTTSPLPVEQPDLIDSARVVGVTRLTPSVSQWPRELQGEVYVAEGDYTHLGQYKAKDAKGFTLIAAPGTRVILPAFDISNTHNVHFEGIEFAGMVRLDDCYNISFEGCKWFDIQFPAAIRTMNVNLMTVSGCVFKDKVDHVHDVGGIQLGARKDVESTEIMIINCIFENLSDGIGLTRGKNLDGDPSNQTGSFPGLLIERCFFRVDRSMYHPWEHPKKGWIEEASCTEGGIDIKSGSLDPKRPVIIRFCVFEGFRPTDQTCGGTGDPGTAIVVHRNGQNIVIEECTFTNCASGIIIFPGGTNKFKGERVANVTILNNRFASAVDALNSRGETTGHFIRVSEDDGIIIEGNIGIGAVAPLYVKPGLKPVENNNTWLN